MAPGGHTASALNCNPTAKAIGITLPPDKEGHEVFLNSYRSTVLYYDITMFAKEFGVDEVFANIQDTILLAWKGRLSTRDLISSSTIAKSYQDTSDLNTGSKPKQTDSQAHN
jgi:hypothetical protein